MASRPSGKMLKSLPPDPARHQDSAITLPTVATTTTPAAPSNCCTPSIGDLRILRAQFMFHEIETFHWILFENQLCPALYLFHQVCGEPDTAREWCEWS